MGKEQVQYKQNCTGIEFVKNVLEARRAMFEKSLYGPFTLFYAPDIEGVLNETYLTTGERVEQKTYREKIAKIDAISEIKVDSSLSTGTAYLEIIQPFTSESN
jgi:hypothetical protein